MVRDVRYHITPSGSCTILAAHVPQAMVIACAVLLLLVPMDAMFEQALGLRGNGHLSNCGDVDDYDPLQQDGGVEVQEMRRMLVRRSTALPYLVID